MLTLFGILIILFGIVTLLESLIGADLAKQMMNKSKK